MEDLLLTFGDWLLNQAAVVVVMGVVIFFQQKEKQALMLKIESDNKEYRKELKQIREQSSKRDLDQLETLGNVSALLDKVDEGIKDTNTTVTGAKDTFLSKIDELKNYIIDEKFNKR